jgi:hypothetical protein
MLFRFSCATFLGLAGIVGTDAFLAPQFGRVRHSVVVGAAEESYNEEFLKALNVGGSSQSEEGDEVSEDEEEVGSGSSRFKAMKAMAAQNAQSSSEERPPMAIDNPFLTPPVPAIQPPVNPDELSVEEQARLFREMTQQQGAAAPPPIPAPPARVAKTDRAGRPQGRNRDADQISNTADVYFAQLKRDSTVRITARQAGDDEAADKVFEDEGIEQLSTLLQANPYLKS